MDNLHGVLVIADETPVGSDLRGNRFGFNIINDVADVPLKGFRFEVFFTEWAERIYTEHNLAAILAEHKGKWIELAVERANRVDGTVTCLWVKKGTDIKIFVGF